MFTRGWIIQELPHLNFTHFVDSIFIVVFESISIFISIFIVTFIVTSISLFFLFTFISPAVFIFKLRSALFVRVIFVFICLFKISPFFIFILSAIAKSPISVFLFISMLIFLFIFPFLASQLFFFTFSDFPELD